MSRELEHDRAWSLGSLSSSAGSSVSWPVPSPVSPRAVVERFGEVVWRFEQVAVKSLPDRARGGNQRGAGEPGCQTAPTACGQRCGIRIPSFLAVAVVVEIGPVLAGVLVATASARAGRRVGVNALNEEIEARGPFSVPIRCPASWRRSDRAPGRPITYGSHRCIGPARALVGEVAAGTSRAALLAQFPGLPAALRRDSGNAQDGRHSDCSWA